MLCYSSESSYLLSAILFYSVNKRLHKNPRFRNASVWRGPLYPTLTMLCTVDILFNMSYAKRDYL